MSMKRLDLGNFFNDSFIKDIFYEYEWIWFWLFLNDSFNTDLFNDYMYIISLMTHSAEIYLMSLNRFDLSNLFNDLFNRDLFDNKY